MSTLAMRERAFAAVLLAVLVPATARAQQERRFFTGVEYRAINFNTGLPTAKVSEFAVPLGMVWTVSPRLTFDVGTRFASASTSDSTGASASLSGLTDTQARLVYQVRPDILAFTFAANLPTGKSMLTGSQLAVAGPIAHDLIPYPVSSFGSGASVTTGLALALPVGGWALGVGGAVRMNGSYQMFVPPDNTQPYTTTLKPGTEVRLRLGADRVIGDSHASFALTYSTFANDELTGQQVSSQQLQPGKRFIAQGAWSQPFMGANLAVYAWDLYRGANLDTASVATTQKQNLLALGAAMTIVRGRGQWRPSIEYRRHWTGFSSLQAEGTLLSLGLRYAMPLGDRMTLLPSARYDMGNVLSDARSDVGYNGFSVSMMVRSAW